MKNDRERYEKTLFLHVHGKRQINILLCKLFALCGELLTDNDRLFRQFREVFGGSLVNLT